MNKHQLADAIVELVHQLGDVTHGTIIQHFGDLVRGDLMLSADNMVFVIGASEVLADAMAILHAEKPLRVTIGVASFLIAMVDGIPMPAQMPWASRPPRGGYKSEHFAPIHYKRLT